MNWAEEEGIRPGLRQAVDEFKRKYEGETISGIRGEVVVPRFHYYCTEMMVKAICALL